MFHNDIRKINNKNKCVQVRPWRRILIVVVFFVSAAVALLFEGPWRSDCKTCISETLKKKVFFSPQEVAATLEKPHRF